MPKGGQADLQLGTAACTKKQGETTRVGAQRHVAREHGSDGSISLLAQPRAASTGSQNTSALVQGLS